MKKNVSFETAIKPFPLIIGIIGIILCLVLNIVRLNLLAVVSVAFMCIVSALIFIGVIFDIIGVAVQSSDTVPFHSMASKKIKTARTAKKMIENSAKVSSFCNDVIGDICGIISGSAATVVSASIAVKMNVNPTISTLLVTSLVAALTIGGKAIGKGIAVSKSEYIITKVTKVMGYFKRK